MVDAVVIKKLREITGAGILKCKEALIECNSDMDEAIKFLRRKGMLKACEKSDRETLHGGIAIFIDESEKKGTILEVNSETDFVGKNDLFQNVCMEVAKNANEYNAKNIEELLNVEGLQEKIQNSILIIGENIKVGRVDTLTVAQGIVVGYVHLPFTAGGKVSKIAALVALESSGDKDQLRELAKKIAMHVVAANPKPKSISIESLDKDFLNKEKEIITAEVSNLNKPEPVKERIIKGKLEDLYREYVLLEQNFLINSDGSKKVADIIKLKEKEIGSRIELVGYKVFSVKS